MQKVIFDRVQKSYFHRNLESAIFQLEFTEHRNRNIYLGILHYENQSYTRALYYIKKHTTKTSKFYEALCYKGIKNYQKAVDSLVFILEGKTEDEMDSETFFDLFTVHNNEYIHELLGECLTHINEREQAINAYTSGCNIYPLYGSFMNLLLEGKIPRSRNEGAFENEFIRDLVLFTKTRDENLLLKYKSNIPGVGTYFIGECARLCIDDGDFDRASVLLENIRKMEPFNLSFSHFHSTLLWYTKETEKLAQLCKTLIEYVPNSHILWIALGNYFSLKFDHARSITCFKRSLHIHTNYYSLLLLGHEYILKQEYTLANKCFTQSTRHFKNNFNAFFSTGIIQASSGKNENAEHFFLKAIKLNSRNIKLKVLLMEFYNRNQASQKACPIFLEVFGLNDLNPDSIMKIIKSQRLSQNEEWAMLELIDYLLTQGHRDKCEEIIEAVRYKGRIYQRKRELIYGKIN